jgi:hypothetical protein
MKNTLTKKELWKVARAVHSIQPWALIGALLHDSPQRHSTRDDRKRIARELGQYYPYSVELQYVEDAWDWFRIYGEEWGAEALAAQRQHGPADALLHSVWEEARRRADMSLELIGAYFPGWPFRSLPTIVYDAIDVLEPPHGPFCNEVPPAAEYKGTGR